MASRKLPVYIQILGSFFLLQGAVLAASLSAVHMKQVRSVNDRVSAQMRSVLEGIRQSSESRAQMITGLLTRQTGQSHEEPRGPISASQRRSRWRLFFDNFSRDHRQEILSRLRRPARAIHMMAIDPNGRLLASTLDKRARFKTDQAFIRRALTGEVGNSVEVIDGTATMAIAIPIKTPELIGVLVSAHPLQGQSSPWRSRGRGRLFITAQDKIIHTSPEARELGVTGGQLVDARADQLKRIIIDGKKYGLAAEPLGEKITLHLILPLEEVEKPLNELRKTLLMIGLASLALTGLAGFLISRGITASIQRLIDKLRDSNDELTRLNEFKDKFFKMVTHDVQNPLTAIMGYADLFRAEAADPATQKRSQSLHRSAETLNFLISDLVDFSSIESGKLRIEPRAMNLSEVVQDLDSRMKFAAGHKGVEFETHPIEGPIPIHADPRRIGQVLQNLASNAINYTPSGGKVSLSARQDKDNVQVSIHDTGIGIKKEDIPKVFSKFFQAQNAQEVRKGGLGLGLNICDEIIRAHGGRIDVDSELGKGSTFTVILPNKGSLGDPHGAA